MAGINIMLKKISSFFILFILCHSSVFAYTLFARNNTKKCCYYYYGYQFDLSDYDYEVDNACVDICIDKTHNLQRCMRACSNYSPTIP